MVEECWGLHKLKVNFVRVENIANSLRKHLYTGESMFV